MTAFALTFDQIRKYFESRLGVSLPARHNVQVRCKWHDDQTPSMSINLKNGTWFCHTCNIGGGILDFERKLTGKADEECWEGINSTIGRDAPKAGKPKHGPSVATYDYTDAAGTLVYQSVRYAEPKDFRQRRPDGKGGWIWNMDRVTRVPFNLPALVRANVALIAEGEKDARNLQTAAAEFPNNDGKLVYGATTNVGGAGKWLDTYSPYLAGRKVFVFHDNDDAGRKHAQQVCASVAPFAQAVQLVELPGLQDKADVSDYLQAHTPAELFALMQATPVWTSPGDEVQPTMTSKDSAKITSELLEMCCDWIRRFVVLHHYEVTILACWLLHTYAFDAAAVTPYVHIHSPEKGSGKTTLMRVLKALARGPRFSSGISAAALARVVAKDKPTLFIDELDALMKGDREKAQDIRGVLDGGFDVSGTYTRCVGKDFEVKDFPTFSPKVLGGIGELWDTVSSRSISVEMRRRLPSEKVEAFRQRRIEKDAIPLREALQAWGGGVVDLLEQIEVTDVPGLDDRQMDISEPLLQIAQLAGDGWLQRLTGALQRVFKAACAEDTSIGVTLLRDIRDVFDQRREDKAKDADEIPSKDLAARLCEIEGRLWAELSHGKGLSPNILAQQLKKFSIHPQGIRVGDKTPKGYRRAAFEDAWARYCPFSPSQSATPPQPASPLTEAAFSDRNTDTPVAVAKSASNPHEQRSVAAVALQKPGGTQMSFFGSSSDDRPRDATTPAEVWI